MDVVDNAQEHISGSASSIHRQWVRSLPYFNPITYDFCLPDGRTPQIKQELADHGFGEEVNYDDDLDPDMRRLFFLAHSPSREHADLFKIARAERWPRSKLRVLFESMDAADEEQEHIPGTPGYIHRQWVRSLTYFNPANYTFFLMDHEWTPEGKEDLVRDEGIASLENGEDLAGDENIVSLEDTMAAIERQSNELIAQGIATRDRWLFASVLDTVAGSLVHRENPGLAYAEQRVLVRERLSLLGSDENAYRRFWLEHQEILLQVLWESLEANRYILGRPDLVGFLSYSDHQKAAALLNAEPPLELVQRAVARETQGTMDVKRPLLGADVLAFERPGSVSPEWQPPIPA